MDTSMPLLKKISTISVVKVLSKTNNCHNCLNGVCNEKTGKCEVIFLLMLLKAKQI